MSATQAFDPPFVLTVKPDSIPALLSNIPQWVGWIVGKQKPNGKYDKLPLNRHATMSSAHDPESWMSFEDAINLYGQGRFSGIGFVLNGVPVGADADGPLFLVGIDMDRCVKSNEGERPIISAEANEVWHSLGRPYLEISPSATGVRMFVLSHQKIASSNSDGHEMYIDGRYLTLTGCGHGDVKEATTAVLALHARWFPKKQDQQRSRVCSASSLASASISAEGNVARVLSALAHISADTNRDDWRDILWAIKSTGWDNAEEIARDWSKTAENRYTDEGFDNVWDSFDPSAGITLGTLFHHAHEAGWSAPASTSSEMEEGDILNGKLYAAAYRGTQLFIHETGEILQFSKNGWMHAEPGLAEMSAKSIVKNLRAEAARLYAQDPTGGETKRKMAHATRSSMEPRVRAMIYMARSEHGMTVRLNEFDADSRLIGLMNGVLDLRTCQLLGVSPDILVSMRARVAFERTAHCPMWMEFLSTVQPDKGVQRLLQQLVGVFLTGESELQKLIILYGFGGNGKSTFIEVISWVLGDYGLRIATEMLMHHQRSPQGPSPDIVALKGRRMVYCNEVEEGRRLDEARVKELTGGDTLTGRTPYAKLNVTFRPTHNLVMVGNHKPEIRDMSHGMWRRVLLIPFDVTIPAHEQDHHLIEKLKTEGSGILNWALAGFRDYQRHGLRIPKAIITATDSYRDEEDLLGEWMVEHCVTAHGMRVAIVDCYKAYRYWAKSRGHNALAQSRLTKRLKERGFFVEAGKRHYHGFGLSEEGAVAASMCLL